MVKNLPAGNDDTADPLEGGGGGNLPAMQENWV